MAACKGRGKQRNYYQVARRIVLSICSRGTSSNRETEALFAAHSWRRGGVVGGVRRMNEVNARRARVVPGWVTVFERVYHLGM